MAINNRHDFHAFSAFRCPDLCPATLGHNEGCVDEAFFFVQCTSVAKLVGHIRQHATQNLIAAPSLKTSMYRFVVGIALRQHMPLRTGVENPQDCFKNATCRDGFASGTTIGNVLLRKMHPDPFPLLVRESNHPTFIADRLQADWGRGRARARVRALWGFSGWRGNETEVLSFPSLKRRI